jgi:hypothetical protein
MIKKTISLCFLLGMLGLMTACAERHYEVRVPPPQARFGAVGYAPGPGYVWCDGYYDWRGGRWFWTNGTWQRPPRHRAVWAPAYWESHGRGYEFHHGRWR